MSLIVANLKRFAQPLFTVLLAFLLVSAGSAQLREAVFIKMQENGVQRLYETEVHVHDIAEVNAVRRLGRVPNRPFPKAASFVAVAEPLPQAPLRVASCRAPPRCPRAPPLS